jgi:hypothetical protein
MSKKKKEYTIPFDVQQAGDECVLFYIYLIEENNQSPAFAAIFALRKAPGIVTDDILLSGAPTISEMYSQDPQQTDKICKEAMKRGYKPKGTDFYNSAIADSTGDPAAFLNHGQCGGHVKKVLESRGYKVTRGGCETESMFNVEAREPELDPHTTPVHKLNPKIARRIKKQKMKSDPGLAFKDQREVNANIVAEHATSS